MTGTWARVLPVLPIVVTLIGPPARAQSTVWYRQFSSGVSTLDLVKDVATARSGNVYVVGQTFGALPGQTHAGDSDAFVRAYDSAGTELWTRQFGTAQFDAARSVGIGRGVFVYGMTRGTLPGQSAANPPPLSDVFVRMYDFAGNEVWTRQFGTDQEDVASGLGTPDSGLVYAVGETLGAFPSFVNNDNLTDAFIRAFDQVTGAVYWTQQFAAKGAGVSVTGVSAKGLAGVYVAGNTLGTMQKGMTGGGYVVKYYYWGTRAWTRQFQAGTNPSGTAFIDVGAARHGVWVVGETPDPLEPLTGRSIPFLRHYGDNGSLKFMKRIRMPSPVAMEVSYLDYYRVYVLSRIGDDPFVTTFEPGGSEAWRARFRTPGNQNAPTTIGLGLLGKLFIGGGVDLDYGDQDVEPSGDAFVMRVNQNPSCADTLNPGEQENGLLSQPIHLQVEPAVSAAEPVQDAIHEVNCTVLVRARL